MLLQLSTNVKISKVRRSILKHLLQEIQLHVSVAGLRFHQNMTFFKTTTMPKNVCQTTLSS